MLYQDLTREIIASAMKVHSQLGNGFQEVVYQRSLAIEFKLKDIGFQRELDMPLFYEKIGVGTRRVDFLVENKVLVEIKAISKLDNIQISQVLNYLSAYNLKIALLINFGSNSLEFKRLRNKKLIKKID